MATKWRFNGEEYTGARIKVGSKLDMATRGKTFIPHPKFKNYLRRQFTADGYIYAFETDIPKPRKR